LITQPIDPNRLTVLKGNTFPLARPQYDHGPAPASLPMDRMILVLKRSPQQQVALAALLQQQEEKSSPSYHHWLTPAAFGSEFGLANQDVQTIVAWLQSQGFQVNSVANGRGVIEFSGTAGQVQQTFHTAIHKYVVKGKAHWANASDPEIPTALAPAVAGIASLNNFRRKPMHVVAGIFRRSKTTGRAIPVQPAYTFSGNGNTFYAVSPYDFATIYNVLPLWNAGIDGTGESIAIIARSDINTQDVDDFRSLFGLPAPNINVIHNGPDPGILSSTGDETESDLDVEWAGAVAKGATIDFVVSESTETSDGVDLSAEYAVDQDIAPVLSDSYGACELNLGTAGNQFYDQLWQQAAAEGITVVVASGDGGSALCDTGNTGASLGLAVDGLASTPYNVAAGGTDFNDALDPTTYWSSTNNSTTAASALGYIPENVWNDTCTNPELAALVGASTDAETNCNDTTLTSQNSFLLQVIGGGGGKSNCVTSTGQSLSSCGGGYPKPAWQTGPGVPNDGVRDLPDISLFSGNGFNGNFYIVCEADQQGGPCNLVSQEFLGVGGTSAAAPTFAAIIAMVNQATKSQQGNANYVLYPLASKTGASCNSSGTVASSCIFYDVTSGTNAMPCITGTPNCVTNTIGDRYGVLTGFNATSGYDLATGLGSVNAANLVNNWNSVTFKASTTTLQLNGGNAVNVTHGTAVPVSITVSPSSPAPTGVVTLIATVGTSTFNAGTFTLSNGAATGSTTLLPGGTAYNVVARYAGDGTYGASESNPVTVTVSSEASKTFANLVTFDNNLNVTSYSASSVTYGSGFYLLRVDVGNSAATYSPTTGISSTCSKGTASCPTGTVTITLNGTALPGGAVPLNINGYAEDQSIEVGANALSAGTYAVSVGYSGDSSYGASTGSGSFTIAKAPTTLSASIQSLPVQYGTQDWPAATLSTTSYGIAPTGTFSFLVDGSPVTLSNLLYQGVAGNPGGSPPSYASYSANGGTYFLDLGSHTLTVNYSGDTNYAAATGSTTFTVTQAQPFFTFMQANPSTVNANQRLTLTAQLYGSDFGAAPTGTITFYSGTTALPGTVTYTTSGPSQPYLFEASMPYTPATPGVLDISAKYSGDTYYLPATSSPATLTVIGPDFSIAAPSTSINIASPGGTGTGSLTVSALQGFTGTIGLSVTCPAGVGITCSLSPSSVALSSTTTSATTTLTIATTAPSMLPPGEKPAGPGSGNGLEIALAGIFGLAMLWLAFGKRESERRWSTALGLLVLASLLALSACGGRSKSTPSSPGTPSGSYTATVLATSGSLSHSITVDFNVQ
jgi:hypothetical protein